MSALYAYNKFFDRECWVGAEVLGDFEVLVHLDDAVEISKEECYEVAIEDSWPLFIQDFYYY